MAYTLNIPLTTNTLDADLLAMKNNFNYLNPAAAIITNIAPAADFTVTQNAVVPFTSVNTGAVVDTLYLKAGNVGIGTTNPGTKLEILSTADDIYALKAVSNGATGKSYGITADAGTNSSDFTMRLRNKGGATDYLVVRGDGNVGIGTTIPSSKLEIKSASGSTLNTYLTTNDYVGSSAGSALQIDFGAASGNTYSRLSALSAGATAWNNLVLQSGGGNVGIGTVSPSGTLDVQSSTNDYTGGLWLGKSGVSSGYIATRDNLYIRPNTTSNTASGGVCVQDVNSATKIALNTNGNSYFNGGNVGIGTANPGRQLELGGTTDAYIQLTRASAANQSALGFKTGATDDWLIRTITNSDLNIYSYGTATNVLTILKASGNVGIGMTPTVQFELSGSVGQKATGTTWSNPSDERLKDILGLANLQRCYDDIKAIPLKRYHLKDDCFDANQASDRTVLGWTAQDVQKVIPKAVNVRPFSKVKVLDGLEDALEPVETEEIITSTETEIVEVGGKLIEKKVTKNTTHKVAQYDDVPLFDEAGEPLLNEDGSPKTHKKPKMITKQKEKFRQDVIEDCLTLDSSQIYAALFGAVQMLIEKVEALEQKIGV